MEALELRVGVIAKVVEAVPEGMLKVGETEKLATGVDVPTAKYPGVFIQVKFAEEAVVLAPVA